MSRFKQAVRWLTGCLLALAALLPFLPRAGAVSLQVTIGMTGELEPLQYLNASGEVEGLHRDLMDAFVEDTKDTVRYIWYESEESCLHALQSGEVDAILGPSLADNPELVDWITEPLNSIDLCAICGTQLAEATDEPLDYQNMLAAYEYSTIKYTYLSKLGAGCYLAVGSQQRVLDALRCGRADLAIGLKDVLLYQLKEAGDGDDYTIVKSYLGEIDYSLAVRPGNAVMLRWLKEHIVQLRVTGRYDSIYAAWSARWSNEKPDHLAVVVRFLGMALGAALVILLFIGAFSLLLRQQLQRMTKTLYDTNVELARQLATVQRESTTQQRIIDASTLCILLFEREGRVTMLNQEACRIAGRSDSLVGSNIMDVAPFSQILAPLRQDGGGIWPQQLPQSKVFRARREEGGELLLKYSLLPLPSDSAHEDLMLMVEDITEEEAQKQKIFEAEKSTTINRIVTGIAHEIRNPLMTIRTFADMIRTEGDNAEFQTAFYEIVPQEVDRINALVSRFINYAKPSGAERAVVDAKSIVQDCLYLTKPVAKRSAIAFSITLEDGLLIRVSANQIKQVLINVIINGIEAMERRIKLHAPDRKLSMEIKAYAQGDSVVISVRDEGVGMTPEDLRKCREPYYTTKQTGIGLGLPVSNELVQLNGGTMTIESRVADHTCITIVFAKEGAG